NFSNILNFSIVHNLFVNLTAINYNFLKPHNGFNLLKAKCPKLSHDREPGSFYMVKLS
ncbi:hypothetical protein SAMN05444682_1041, partial [Parapedobacter indicus]